MPKGIVELLPGRTDAQNAHYQKVFRIFCCHIHLKQRKTMVEKRLKKQRQKPLTKNKQQDNGHYIKN